MFYQFWLRVEDEDVYKFLNFFTFLSEEYIQQVKINDESSKNKPIAQSILAEEVTRFVHGQEHLDAAKRSPMHYSAILQKISCREISSNLR